MTAKSLSRCRSPGSSTVCSCSPPSSAAASVRSEHGASVGLAAVAGEREAQGAVPVALAAALDGGEHGQTVLLPGDRHRLRDFAVINLLDHLRKVLIA